MTDLKKQVDDCCEMPLLDLLRDVPQDLRAEWPTHFSDYGTPIGFALSPIGKLIHKAADLIDQQAAEIERLEADRKSKMETGIFLTHDSIEEFKSTTIKEWKEKCAKVAENIQNKQDIYWQPPFVPRLNYDDGHQDGCQECAEAIRNLPEGDE